MTNKSLPALLSRRDALRFITAAPMLPLGAFASSAVLSGCATTAGPAGSYASASFTSMAAPSLSNPAAMATTTVASSLKVAFTGGAMQDYKLAYHPFFITGDMVPNCKGG